MFGRAFGRLGRRSGGTLLLILVLGLGLFALYTGATFVLTKVISGGAESLPGDLLGRLTSFDLGGAIDDIVGRIQTILLVALLLTVAVGLGWAYLFAGVAGALARSVGSGEVSVSFASFTAGANRSLGGTIVLWIIGAFLTGLGLVAAGILVAVLRDIDGSGQAIVGLVSLFVILFWAPVLLVASAAIPTAGASGTGALPHAWRLAVRRLPATLGIGLMGLIASGLVGIGGPIAFFIGPAGQLVWAIAFATLLVIVLALATDVAATGGLAPAVSDAEARAAVGVPAPAGGEFAGGFASVEHETTAGGFTSPAPAGGVRGAIIGVMSAGRPLPEVRVPSGGQVVVGRDPASSLVLRDPLVSRRHLLVNVVAGAWEVTDLGSRNPTRIVGPDGREQVLSGAARLAAGQLRIGETVLTLFPIDG